MPSSPNSKESENATSIRSGWNNPLRWYLAGLLIGMLLSLLWGDIPNKWQAQRLAELLPAIGLLAWCITHKSETSSREQIATGLYGLGFLGFAVVSIWSAFFGEIFLISMSYVGLVLLQFGLLPLLKPVWRDHRDDTLRLFAVFALAILGIDVGFLIIARFWNLNPYALTRFWQPIGERWLVWDNLYLFINSRWANQLAVLLIWSYIPVLDQLKRGIISTYRWFWWVTCAVVPILGIAQIVVTRGDGAFIAVVCGVTALALMAWCGNSSTKPIYSISFLWLSACLIVMLLLSLMMGYADFSVSFLTRNLAEFSPDHRHDRLLLWLSYGREALTSFPFGNGIPAVPIGSPICTPHNLWFGLAYWSGLLSIPFAMMLASGFIPSHLNSRFNPISLPLLTSLFVYGLVDDIWHRPLALAVLLIMLPSLDCDVLQKTNCKNSLLGFFVLPAFSYRLFALIGVTLIVFSTLIPGGTELGQSFKVAAPDIGSCLLML